MGMKGKGVRVAAIDFCFSVTEIVSLVGEGHCEVCKLEWYTCRVDSSVGACGLSRLAQACCLIRVFVVLGYAVKFRWRSQGER